MEARRKQVDEIVMDRTCPKNGPGKIANENLKRNKMCTDRDGNDLTM